MNTNTTVLTINTVSAVSALPAEPSILSANTYFWTPAANASSRRRNEERHANTVADYLRALGFSVTVGSSVTGALDTAKGEVVVTFSYSESCKNVYKHLSVTRAGKNSNITTLRKIHAALEAETQTVSVVTAVPAPLSIAA